MELMAVVETPTGSRNKYEMDPATGQIRLDRTLTTSQRFPVDYGFLPGTLSKDSDPLDVLIVVEEPTFPGCRIRCRPIALLQMRDQHGDDVKILCVPASSPEPAWSGIRDVPVALRKQIAHFFSTYKDLDPPSKWSQVGKWLGKSAAKTAVKEAQARAGNSASEAPTALRTA